MHLRQKGSTSILSLSRGTGMMRQEEGRQSPVRAYLNSGLSAQLYEWSPVNRKCSVVSCLLSSEAKTAATSLIPLALKVWSRSPAVRNVKNCFLGALKSKTFLS